jgi:hypothetical protein
VNTFPAADAFLTTRCATLALRADTPIVRVDARDWRRTAALIALVEHAPTGPTAAAAHRASADGPLAAHRTCPDRWRLRS